MRLRGYIDGVEIKFDFYPPSTWKAIVPKKLTGAYIIQLKVIDTAGNESNFADLFICIDFQSMDIEILGKKYAYKNEKDDFLCIKLDSQHKRKTTQNVYVYNELDDAFSYKRLVVT